MVVCFVAVIFLAFFTGIAVGYIFFEFYAINNSLIQFNYMEGDEEVGNFLEDIRRSKDNGARMLNIRNGIKLNNTSMSSVSNSKAPMSMSALLRQNMEEANEEQTTIDNPFNTPFEKQVLQEQNNNEMLEETINNEEHSNTDNLQISESSPQSEDSEFEFTEDNVPDDEFDVEDYDSDFLQKYFYDKDVAQATDDSGTEDKTDITDNVPSDENINDTENLISDDLMDDIFSSMSDSEDVTAPDSEEDMSLLTTPIPEDEDSTIKEIGKEIKNNESFNDDFMSMLDNISVNDDISETSAETKNETLIDNENKEDTASKSDKIESSVCISLGGSSTSTEGLLNIPLVMTEKPIEPTEPPKRKRGRPRKKK